MYFDSTGGKLKFRLKKTMFLNLKVVILVFTTKFSSDIKIIFC